MPNEPFAAPSSVAAITIMGSGRLGPTIAALLGLTATVLGARALARARRPTSATSSAEGRDRRLVVPLLGALAVLLGGLFLAAADGGPGTGNGVVGSAAAVGFGCIAIVLDRVAAGQGSRGAMATNPIDLD